MDGAGTFQPRPPSAGMVQPRVHSATERPHSAVFSTPGGGAADSPKQRPASARVQGVRELHGGSSTPREVSLERLSAVESDL
jgi:hypothetical protein